MELLQLKSGDKISLILIQPTIMCSGRSRISCHYRGRVISIDENKILISFKRYGDNIIASYDIRNDEFDEQEYKDIKIKYGNI